MVINGRFGETQGPCTARRNASASVSSIKTSAEYIIYKKKNKTMGYRDIRRIIILSIFFLFLYSTYTPRTRYRHYKK